MQSAENVQRNTTQFELLKVNATLKYSQGHSKQNGWGKLSKYCHHAKVGIFHIYCVPESHNVMIFDISGLTLIITYTQLCYFF